MRIQRTAILSPSGAFAGIGFAIAVDEINRIVPQLISRGKIVRPRMGVQIAEDQQARSAGVHQGALIVHVTPNSPTDRAGLQGLHRDRYGRLQIGDVGVAIDGKPVSANEDVYSGLEGHKAGATVTVTVLRKGQREDVLVTLEIMD
jgi:S1-C subfamily serine protease